MPSIYPTLKESDRKYIRTQKALIRRQFLDMAKQEEMISDLYKKLLGKSVAQESNEVKAEKPKTEVKAEKPKAKTEVKKAKQKKVTVK